MIDYALATIGFVGSVLTIIGVIYTFLRNFKIDINSHIDRLEKRMDSFDQRMDNFEFRMNSLDERMFLLMTGKNLSDAIKEERMKKLEGK